MKKVALFFGSFNPIHNGHLILANYIAEYCDVDEVRFIVSPQNPFKQNKHLLSDDLRLRMVKTAIADYPKFTVSDVEFRLPKPSYTIDTLLELRRQDSDTQFALIIGGDNLQNFSKWKNVDAITEMCEVWVYPRPNYNLQDAPALGNRVKILQDAPLVEVSSTVIRRAKREGKDLRYFLPQRVWKMMPENADAYAD